MSPNTTDHVSQAVCVAFLVGLQSLLSAPAWAGGEAERPRVLVTYLNVFGRAEQGWAHWRWQGSAPDGSLRMFDPERRSGPEPWRREIGVGAAGDYPLIGPYHAGDIGVMRYHFDCMRRTGVDGVLLYLYDDPAFYSEERTLRTFLDEAHEAGLSVGFCDSEGEIAVVQRFDGQYSPAYYEDCVARAERTLATYAGHPAYLRVDGRPFWMAGLNMEHDPARVGAFVAALRARAGDVFVAVVTNAVYYMYEFGRELVPGWPTQLEDTLLTQAWADSGADLFTCYSPLALAHAEDATAQHLWQVVVDDSAKWGKRSMVFLMSGYDDSHWRSTLPPLPREDGAAWRRRLRTGLAVQGADFIAIQCWNEWHEGAILEPNLGFRGADGTPDPFCNLRILAEELGVPWTAPKVPRELFDPLLVEHGGDVIRPFVHQP